jgi:hypothetical protein
MKSGGNSADTSTLSFARLRWREARELARTAVATALIAATIVTLAVASLIHGHERATAQSPVVIEPAPSFATAPSSAPLDSGEIGPFAFGFLVFDWDPCAPGGVPGFDPWLPGKRP